MRPDALLSAVARAEKAARLAYTFNANGYVADVVSAVASLRVAIDAPDAPDWILEFERWSENNAR
jgi:hypothetical protein